MSRHVTVSSHGIKTFLLALTAAVAFVAAVLVGLGQHAKNSSDVHGIYRTTTNLS
jgi:hypothetical protein